MNPLVYLWFGVMAILWVCIPIAAMMRCPTCRRFHADAAEEERCRLAQQDKAAPPSLPPAAKPDAASDTREKLLR